jgi:transcriptional regulator with XRE-family HTH domain
VLATDLGSRLVDLREAMGWTQEQLADAVGRRPNAVSEWEREIRKPPESALTRLCRNYGWPEAIFEEGGPMPSTVVNRPAKARETPTPYLGRGHAHRYFVGVMRDLMDAIAAGQNVPAETAMGYVTGLWNAATREAPQLMRPAVNDEGGSGGNAAGG